VAHTLGGSWRAGRPGHKRLWGCLWPGLPVLQLPPQHQFAIWASGRGGSWRAGRPGHKRPQRRLWPGLPALQLPPRVCMILPLNDKIPWTRLTEAADCDGSTHSHTITIYRIVVWSYYNSYYSSVLWNRGSSSSTHSHTITTYLLYMVGLSSTESTWQGSTTESTWQGSTGSSESTWQGSTGSSEAHDRVVPVGLRAHGRVVPVGLRAHDRVEGATVTIP